MYGLRRREAANLLLQDIDWAANRFTVRRAKRGGFQQFPLSKELGAAIRRYIETARPRCSFPNVFISLKAPFRPLISHSISDVVRSRMRKLGIPAKHCGPQCLRQACATRLLDTGASFIEIADFLGHRDTQNVNVYARVSAGTLREVAAVDLIGAL
jgi:integrase